MTEFKLFLDQEPAKFDRVHAILLTPDGRVLLRYKNGEPRVTGGRIDLDDEDLVAALKREIREEINCEIDKCDYLGYLETKEVDEQTGEITYESWGRMVARIAGIGAPLPDPDRAGSWIYGRALAPLARAKSEMGSVPKFGPNNLKLLEVAYAFALKHGYFTKLQNPTFEVINTESHT